MLNIGDKIRDYKVISKIGEGGMGTVYLAEDVMLDKKVAIKVLSPNLLSDHLFIERFRNEAKVQASLSHQNIVTLHSFIQEDSKYLMVMEYVNGKTIKEILNTRGALSEQNARKYFLQILDAIGFAHSMGIVHRDLKPSNIVIDMNDNIKIMDFGIAKVLGDRSLTKTGTKMGTIYYMSPEQIKAEKNIDQRTDIYSLGIVFYEMLTGKIPFNTSTESDFEIMREIVEGRGINEEELEGRVSDLMINVLLKMTSKNRENRFATCYQIAEALNLNKTPVLIEQPEIKNIYQQQTESVITENLKENYGAIMSLPKADFGRRLGAYILDIIVSFLIILPAILLFGIGESNMKDKAAFGAIFLIIAFILSLIKDGINKGKGIGKGMVGLRSIDLQANQVLSKGKSAGKRILDSIIYAISSVIIPYVGGVIILIIDIVLCNSKNGQRIVDKMLSIQVVNESDIVVDDVTGLVKPSDKLKQMYPMA